MPLTVTQKATKIKAAKAKLAKAEKVVTDIDAIKAEIEWLESAPTVADRPKRAAKKAAAAPAEGAPANA